MSYVKNVKESCNIFLDGGWAHGKCALLHAVMARCARDR